MAEEYYKRTANLPDDAWAGCSTRGWQLLNGQKIRTDPEELSAVASLVKSRTSTGPAPALHRHSTDRDVGAWLQWWDPEGEHGADVYDGAGDDAWYVLWSCITGDGDYPLRDKY